METFLDSNPNTPQPDSGHPFSQPVSIDSNHPDLSEPDSNDSDSNPHTDAKIPPPIFGLTEGVPALPIKESLANVPQDFQPLDPRNVAAERIAGLILAGIVSIGLLIGTIVIWFNIGANLVWILIAIAAAVLSTSFLIYVWYWPTVAHRHAHWRLDEEGLEIRQGVYWKHQVTIPLGRVQHADVSQGPLQRAYGLGTLTVNTAGTQNASVDLAGLAHEKAIELRDQVVRQRKDQHVV